MNNTLFKQAIAELETRRVEITMAITTLRAVVDGPSLTIAAVLLKATPVKPAPTPKAAQPVASPPILPQTNSARVSLVVAALTKANRPMRRNEVATATKLSDYQAKEALKQLLAEKRVMRTGATNTLRWTIAVNTKPFTEPVFDVAWNGTKDAKGEASLIGDRPRKAS
jgi:hypothetical protein